MEGKTFAIITDIHSNVSSLKRALEIIEDRDDIDQKICLGDCFALGPSPKETLEILKSIENCIFLRGNHDRYLIERLWEQERPSLEGMNPDDPICQAIVANEEWTAEQVGDAGVEFVKAMHIAYREVVDNTLVEMTHAWYQRDDMPPTITEALNWRNHVKNAHPKVTQYVFVHGHVHTPRNETDENLTILCQGATGLPFDEDPRGSVAFLTVARESFNWDVVRYEYDQKITIDLLEDRKPPFYQNLQNTVKYAAIRNDV
jgi:predicted phosphodiesterase